MKTDPDGSEPIFFDPGDLLERDRGEADSETADELGRILAALPEPSPTQRPPTPLTEEQLERLRSLGYVR